MVKKRTCAELAEVLEGYILSNSVANLSYVSIYLLNSYLFLSITIIFVFGESSLISRMVLSVLALDMKRLMMTTSG